MGQTGSFPHTIQRDQQTSSGATVLRTRSFLTTDPLENSFTSTSVGHSSDPKRQLIPILQIPNRKSMRGLVRSGSASQDTSGCWCQDPRGGPRDQRVCSWLPAGSESTGGMVAVLLWPDPPFPVSQAQCPKGPGSPTGPGCQLQTHNLTSNSARRGLLLPSGEINPGSQSQPEWSQVPTCRTAPGEEHGPTGMGPLSHSTHTEKGLPLA